jgi:hypothetical protein
LRTPSRWATFVVNMIEAMVSDGRQSAPNQATRSAGDTTLVASSTTTPKAAAGPGPTCAFQPILGLDNTRPKVTIIVPYAIASCIWEGLPDVLTSEECGGAAPKSVIPALHEPAGSRRSLYHTRPRVRHLGDPDHAAAGEAPHSAFEQPTLTEFPGRPGPGSPGLPARPLFDPCQNSGTNNRLRVKTGSDCKATGCCCADSGH